MSLDAINWVAKQTTGDAKSKAALFWLAFHHNSETGLCCPSNRMLMAEMEVGSDNTVRLALNRLRELGLISWTREYKNGAVARTLFTLNFKAGARPSIHEGPSTVEVPQPLREGQSLKEGPSVVAGGSLSGCGRVPQPLRGNKEKNKEENKEGNNEVVGAPSDAHSSPAFSEIEPPFDEALFELAAQGPDPDAGMPIVEDLAGEVKPKKPRKPRQPLVPFPPEAPPEWITEARKLRPDIDPQRVFTKLRVRYAPTSTQKTLGNWRKIYFTWIGGEYANTQSTRISPRNPATGDLGILRSQASYDYSRGLGPNGEILALGSY